MRDIVVGTDGSPTAGAAVAYAIDLAVALQGRLHLVAVHRPRTAVLAPEAIGAEALMAEADAAARRQLDDALDREAKAAKGRGVVVEMHTPVGDPADILIDIATRVDAELLVVGSRGMKGARRLLGSVPNNITHHAPCHVLVVKTC
jgi:nucleotide-binding universal stress UspA family protein